MKEKQADLTPLGGILFKYFGGVLLDYYYYLHPLQEKYPNISTYACTFQNPVKYIDPNGMEGEDGIWKMFSGFFNFTKTKYHNADDPKEREMWRREMLNEHERVSKVQSQILKDTQSYIELTTDIITTVHPLGSTIKVSVQIINGVDVQGVDVIFAGVEVVTMGAGSYLKYSGKGAVYGLKTVDLASEAAKWAK